MKTMLSLAALAAILTLACNESVTRTQDTEQDTIVEDTSIDVPIDVPPDTIVPDGDDTIVPDPVEVVDTADTPSDPIVEDTVGLPCTTDEECDDGLFCNGEEYCHPAGDCRRAPAPDCADGDACTTDSCDETTAACLHVIIDGDSDGYAPESCGGPDCNDSDGTINPGAADICEDGIDQDCDGIDAPPGSCDCPVDLTVGTTPTGSTAGMASTYDGSCAWGSGAPEVVYELVLTSAMDVLFDLAAPGWYGIVYVTLGTCDGTEVGCAIDYDPASVMSLGAGTYYVFVDGADSGDEGDYTLTVREYIPPTPVTGNDDCGSAYALTASGTYGGNDSALTDNAEPATCATSARGRGGHDAFFSFTLTATTTVSLNTDGSSYDTILYIRQGSCTGTEIACDDDSGAGTASAITRSLTAGTYYVILDDFYHTNGDWILNVTGL